MTLDQRSGCAVCLRNILLLSSFAWISEIVCICCVVLIREGSGLPSLGSAADFFEHLPDGEVSH